MAEDAVPWWTAGVTSAGSPRTAPRSSNPGEGGEGDGGPWVRARCASDVSVAAEYAHEEGGGEGVGDGVGALAWVLREKVVVVGVEGAVRVWASDVASDVDAVKGVGGREDDMGCGYTPRAALAG